MATDHVNYICYGNKKEVLDERYNAACYYDLLNSSLPRKTKDIVTYPLKEDVPYNEEQIKVWIEVVNNMGFPCTYENKDNSFHYFNLPIRIGRKIVYKQKLHLASGLILVRYLWEIGLNEIPKIYFKLKEALPEEDDFLLVQMAHGYVKGYANDNHALMEFNFRRFTSKKKMFEKMKDYSVYQYRKPQINNAWQEGQIRYFNSNEAKNYREVFNQLK